MYQYPHTGRARPKSLTIAAGPWERPTGLPTAVAFLEDSLTRELIIATDNAFRAVHAKTVAEAAMAVRENAARALLLSPALLARESVPAIRMLLARCPGVRSIALLAPSHEPRPAQLLTLGSLGIHDVIDLRVPSEYGRLRDLIGTYDPVVTGKIMIGVLHALSEAHPGVKRFFGVLIQASPDISATRELAKLLGISASTLASRFFRAGLPSPKLYLAHVRLAHAAGYFEGSRHTIADVAHRLHYSSPQSFGRHVHGVLGITAGQFRTSFTLDTAIARFNRELILPHVGRLSCWHPLSD